MGHATERTHGEPGQDRDQSRRASESALWSWPAELRTLRKRFCRGYPFPHLVLDDVFDPVELMRIHGEVPDPRAGVWTLWGSGGEDSCGSRNSKRGISTQLLLGETTARFLRMLNSDNFVADLCEIVGGPTLCVDHTFNGGGLQCTGRGGRLRVHVDKVRHPYADLFDQAINLILFIQPTWREPWGGHLEFWSREAREVCVSIFPRFNRLVLFRSDRESFHGHPQPLTCPDGIYRTSLAVYYYRRRPTALSPGHSNDIDWRN